MRTRAGASTEHAGMEKDEVRWPTPALFNNSHFPHLLEISSPERLAMNHKMLPNNSKDSKN